MTSTGPVKSAAVYCRLSQDRTGESLGIDRQEQLCRKLAALPFPAAIWEIGTGENFSRVLTAAGRSQPVAGAITEEFGLPLPSHVDALRSRFDGARARLVRRLSTRRESLEDLRARIQEPGAATPDDAAAGGPPRD